jgi:hypothetical protein
MEARALLADLVREGVVETIAPASAPQAAAPMRPAPPPVEAARPPAPEPPRASVIEMPPPPPSAAFEPPAIKPAVVEEPPPAPEPPAPPPVTPREDLDAHLAERLGGFGAEAKPPRSEAAPAPDDRVSGLSGIFAPGPAAAGTPAPESPRAPEAAEPRGAPRRTAPAAEWTAPPPATTEAPKNTWAPTATPAATEPAWSAPTQAPQAAEPPPRFAEPPPRFAEPPPAAQAPSAPAAAPKKGGLFGMFRRDEMGAAMEPQASPAGAAVASRTGLLASFANALLVEYNSGAYGKGKVESRMANLLMRVDEQADPIDRPLPIVDDLIDATALEREALPETQAAPYLATLVRTIYEDAERVFGKDKAKKGYKTAQQQVYRTDASSLSAPDVAAKLPRV